jgi:hypothetical protein
MFRAFTASTVAKTTGRPAKPSESHLQLTELRFFSLHRSDTFRLHYRRRHAHDATTTRPWSSRSSSAHGQQPRRHPRGCSRSFLARNANHRASLHSSHAPPLSSTSHGTSARDTTPYPAKPTHYHRPHSCLVLRTFVQQAFCQQAYAMFSGASLLRRKHFQAPEIAICNN